MTAGRAYIYGVQVEAEVEAAEVEVYVGHEITPGSFGWVVPTVDGRARVGLTAYDRPLDRLARLLDHPRLRGRNCRLTGRPVVAPLPLGVLPRTPTVPLLDDSWGFELRTRQTHVGSRRNR